MSAALQAYRELALRYHPDKCAEPSADLVFKIVGEAYDTLCDGSRRSVSLVCRHHILAHTVLNDFPIDFLHRRMTGLVQSVALDQRTWIMTGNADGAGVQALGRVAVIGDKGSSAKLVSRHQTEMHSIFSHDATCFHRRCLIWALPPIENALDKQSYSASTSALNWNSLPQDRMLSRHSTKTWRPSMQ